MVSIVTFKKMALAFTDVTEQSQSHQVSFFVKDKLIATLEESSQLATFKLNKKGQGKLIRLDEKAVYPAPGNRGLKGWTTVNLKLADQDIVATGLNMAHNLATSGSQLNNPLHGVKLADILEHLVDTHGWKKMGQQIPVRCFTHDPSIKSSLTFLRRTPWARAKVEEMYLKEC